jgi:hypothetical protein
VFTGAFAGAGRTVAVGRERAVSRPSLFEPVISTRIVWPTSSETSLYVERVAPAIAAQSEPPTLHRSQRMRKVIGSVPFQVPPLAVSVWPSCACPSIDGGVTFVGAVLGAAADTAAESPSAETVAARSNARGGRLFALLFIENTPNKSEYDLALTVMTLT